MPFWDADLRAAFLGLSREHGPAISSGRCSKASRSSTASCSAAPRPRPGLTVDEVRLGGGAARIATWAQIKADVLERPVATVTAEEPGVLGAAIAAFVGLGTFKSFEEAQQLLVRVAKTLRAAARAARLLSRARPIVRAGARRGAPAVAPADQARAMSGIIERYGTALAGVLLFAAFAATAPRFLDPTNLLNVLKHASVLALFALGVTLALVTAELDLSFANVASLAAVVTGYLVHKGYPVPLAVASGLGVGLVAGVLNGLLVTRLKIPSLIATLGTAAIANGFAFWATQGVAFVGRWPAEFTALARGTCSAFRRRCSGPAPPRCSRCSC